MINETPYAYFKRIGRRLHEFAHTGCGRARGGRLYVAPLPVGGVRVGVVFGDNDASVVLSAEQVKELAYQLSSLNTKKDRA